MSYRELQAEARKHGINAYQRKAELEKALAAKGVIEKPNVETVVRRFVRLTGEGCYGDAMTIALVRENGDEVIVYPDADDMEDGERFTTKIADLKAAVTALENLS